ncbi:rifin PIR protein, putative [Plasmodium reichenowi]|uniref:Rifin PIR protein, putative n=1 Tax=Plasmodium reichenowi TaxID=5854 RepID=A0A2P9DT38_PLARE|nr:rifin PIR protein, putative [Plasmodium reichenowi]
MKVHYINILLFAFPLNILVHYQGNHKKTIHCTPKTKPIKPHRSLCQCELYTPSNYDNDPQMKSVIENFNKQTQQRFHEYEERIQYKRQKYKDKCDKEIQKIILKDKLEKELTEKFATLQTDIQSDAIPTCVCEKTVADKVEKNCLKCTQNLGKIVAPSSGVLAGISEAALYAWKPKALAAAIESALELNADKIAAAAKAAGNTRGMEIVTEGLKALGVEELGINSLESFFTESYHINIANAARIIAEKHGQICAIKITNDGSSKCIDIGKRIGTHYANGLPDGPPATDAVTPKLNAIVTQAEGAVANETINVTASETLAIETAEKEAIETTFMGYQNTITASIIAIVVIILVMVIIYLILRYRRKKKMKKKLQYIKLLEE